MLRASEVIGKALQIVEARRVLLSSRKLQASYFANKDEMYALDIDLKMQLGDAKPEYVTAALETSERQKARVLVDLVGEAEALHGINSWQPDSDKVLLELIRRRQLVKSKLNIKGHSQAALPKEEQARERGAAIAKEINELTYELDLLEEQIKARHPRYAELTKPRPLKLVEIQQQLDHDTLLLEYSLGEKRSYVWAVTPDSIHGFELPAREKIEKVAHRFRSAVTARNQQVGTETGTQRNGRLSRADAESSAAATELTKLVLEPVAALLGQKRLAIVSGGALQLVPFAALPVPVDTVTRNAAAKLQTPTQTLGGNPRFLSEYHEIVNLPSASVLAVQRRELSNRKPATNAIAVLADPVFDEIDMQRELKTRSARQSVARPKQQAAVTSQESLPANTTTSDLSRALRDVGVLIMIPRFDRSRLFDSTISALGSASNPFNSSLVRVLGSLALDAKLHQPILANVSQVAATIENSRIAAEEKIEALVRLSRLLVLISPKDAQSLFNRAIKVSGELNEEAVNEIGLFEPLARRGAPVMATAPRRSAANNLGAVVSDAWIRLDGPEGFPWAKASRALGFLDVNIALAVTARWEDAGIVSRSTLLPPIMETSLVQGSLSPGQVAALLPLLDYSEEELLIAIARRAREIRAINSEELAWGEVLRFGQGTRATVNDEMIATSGSVASLWLRKLMEATDFHRQLKSPGEGHRSVSRRWPKKRGSLGRVNWKKQKYISSETVETTVRQVLPQTKADFIPVSIILDRMSVEVQLADRVAHLEALRGGSVAVISDEERIEAISRRIEDWHDSPSVVQWARENSLDMLVDKLPTFAGWLYYYKRRIRQFLKHSGAADHEISRAC